MNETFSFNRYSKLLKKEFTERAPMMTKIAAIFSLILVGYWITLLLFGNDSAADSRLNYALLATVLTMIIAPFNLYKSYNHKKKGIDYILLPASVTEKFLSMQVLCVIVLPAIVFISVMLTDLVFSAISPTVFQGSAVAEFFGKGRPFADIIETFIFQQGCILGNFVFRKSKIFKTMISGTVLFIVFASILTFCMTVIFKDQMVAIQNMGTNLQINAINYPGVKDIMINGQNYEMLSGIRYVTIAIYYILFPAAFIGGTYYKMKTQQY